MPLAARVRGLSRLGLAPTPRPVNALAWHRLIRFQQSCLRSSMTFGEVGSQHRLVSSTRNIDDDDY